MKPSSFDPQWYEQQKDELLAEDNADQNQNPGDGI